MTRRTQRPGRLLVLGACLAAALCVGCISVELFGGGRRPLVESVVHVHGTDGEDGAKLLLIDVDGFIGRGDASSLLGAEPEGTVARLREQLDRASRDPEIAGILLRIDSPGGSATASDVVYAELRRFKTARQIPVVAHLYGTAASGGYYVAMSADEIVAEPTAVTGSIGVIFTSVNLAGLMERYGVVDQTTKSGVYKDTGSMLRPQTEAERAILQGVIDDLAARFVAVVATGRPRLAPERVAELSDGRIYSAPQALENGLIDRIGDIEDAVSALQARVGQSASYVVTYHRPSEWRQNLHTRSGLRSPEAGVQAGIRSPIGRDSRWLEPGFHYLWWPGALPISLPGPGL